MAKTAAVLIALASVAPGLFALNGIVLAAGHTPVTGTTSRPAATPIPTGEQAQVRIVAYNVAKGFAHLGGLDFAPSEDVQARLLSMAQNIRAYQPDLVFLSEVLTEYPGGVNQVVFLAQHTGMHAWAFGEHYNFGVPFYRVVGGTAILSRWPLEPVTNADLPGRQPFFVTTNNRRALFCSVMIAGEPVLLASLHNDSFDSTNRLAQTRWLLEYVAQRPAVLAGDFNANPGEPPINLIRSTGRFSATLDGPPTYPADSPEQSIDHIFGPASWQVARHWVMESTASDHRPVGTTFRLGQAGDLAEPTQPPQPAEQ